MGLYTNEFESAHTQIPGFSPSLHLLSCHSMSCLPSCLHSGGYYGTSKLSAQTWHPSHDQWQLGRPSLSNAVGPRVQKKESDYI